MGNKKETKQASTTSEQAPVADWFGRHISRRTVGKGMAWTAILSMAGVTIYKFSGDDDSEINYDSLELQKKEGWNVGSNNRSLLYAGGLTSLDSRQKAWVAFDPNYLISIYQPGDAAWQPFFVPTLLQSLSQPTLNSQIRQIMTPAMSNAYGRGEGLRNLLSQTWNTRQTLIVADLPGPDAVALGASMADTVHLVPVFDNWPHPLGVVRSHETLGAMIYFANEIEEKKSALKDESPVMLMLDSSRLTPYTNEDSQFDNRYLAKLPPSAQLKERGINQIIYLVRDQFQTRELDDINDDLVAWQKNGIDVRMLRLSDFKPVDEPEAGQRAGGSSPVVHRHYYYGGSPLSHWWFYSHYAYQTPRSVVVGGSGAPRTLPRPASAPAFQPPSYRPVTRPTIFNASRIGGTSGVGKTKPSGFGRTSVRVSSSGRITGTRIGRSGSYGRSGGGWFGG